MSDIKLMEDTSNAIIAARRALAEAREKTIEAKEALKDHECDLIIRGVSGKNKEERDAHLYADTEQARLAIIEAEKRERAAILELEICKDIRRCQENMISVELMKEEA